MLKKNGQGLLIKKILKKFKQPHINFKIKYCDKT